MVDDPSRDSSAVGVLRVLIMSILLWPAAVAGEVERIHVGIYDNPPKVFVAEDGHPTGFWPELTRVIAEREGWQVEWVPGSWPEGLERLHDGRIDVLVDTVVSDRRRAAYGFGAESVHVSWSRIYASPGSRVEIIPDLDGKRIGALAGSANLSGPGGLEDLLGQFAVEAETVPFDSYRAVFEALAAGRLDAGIVNLDFGNRMSGRFDLTPTAIVLQPVDLRYAFPRDAPATPGLVAAFDRHLADLKADSASPYHGLLDEWLGSTGAAVEQEAILPPWAVWALGLLLASVILVAVGLFLVERRVHARTRQLRERELELKQQRDMLVRSQRVARTGSWRFYLRDGRLEWSDELYRVAGVSPETFTPTPEAFKGLIHPEDVERFSAMREAAIQGRQPPDVRFRLIRPDGETRFVTARAEIGRGRDGEPVLLTGTVRDVTEARQSEVRLQHYRRLIEHSSDLFAIIDADYRYVLANDAYAALYRLDGKSIEGMHLPDVLGPGIFEREAKPRIDRSLAGEPQIFEGEREYPHLGIRRFLIRYHPLGPPDGGIHQVSAVMTDVTEIRRAEETLRQQAHLLDIAGRVSRLGGWSTDLGTDTGRTEWSNVLCDIMGMPRGHVPGLDEGIKFYAPEYREHIRRVVDDCVRQGRPFDERAEIINTRGQRLWVRVAGEPERDASGKIVRIHGALQDISPQMEADLALDRLNKRLTNILDSITDAFFTLDPHWRFDYVNAEAERQLQRQPGTLTGKYMWEEFPGAEGSPFEQAYRRAMADRVTMTLEAYYEPMGRWFDVRAYPSDQGLAVYFRDVTERHLMEEQLHARERELRGSRDRLAEALETRQSLINALPANVALLDNNGVILDVNAQWEHFGQESAAPDLTGSVGVNYLSICEATTGDCAEDALHARDGLRAVLAGERATFSMEYPCHSPGQPRWFRMMANRIGDGRSQSGEAGAVVMHVDITDRKLAEEELNRIAFVDSLTGLPSRNGFLHALEGKLERSWPAGATVVMLDLEALRDINDSHGFEAGNEVLIEVGLRLQAQTGEDGLVGRADSDEFLVFVPHWSAGPDLDQQARLADVFTRPFDLEDISLEVDARFGYTLLRDHRREVSSLVREAELALFQSRRADTARRWTAYTAGLDEAHRERIRLTEELRRAMDQGEFRLHFQPKVELGNGRLVACEALIRWHHPVRGLIPPAAFIPIAEQSQLIGPIGDWVLREACRCLREWQDAGLGIVRVAVNVSLVQFTMGDFAASVRAALDTYRVAPRGLTLEITESIFERESGELLRQLQALREMGVRLSLDDFGTGYSSLLYLQKYRFDEIKIDQTFVRRMLEDEYSRRIVTTVISLARALETDVVAEGVETAALRDALLELGCVIGQGYHYSIPLEASDFRRLLERQTALPLPRREHG